MNGPGDACRADRRPAVAIDAVTRVTAAAAAVVVKLRR